MFVLLFHILKQSTINRISFVYIVVVINVRVCVLNVNVVNSDNTLSLRYCCCYLLLLLLLSLLLSAVFALYISCPRHHEPWFEIDHQMTLTKSSQIG